MNYDSKNQAQARGLGKSAAVKEAERRTSDRQLFAATAEVIEEVTGARFSTRTMDLSPGGCFIDTTNPLPVGTRVHVKVSRGKADFRTNGTVVYSQIGMGMGIAFLDLTEGQQEELQAWLTAQSTEKPLANCETTSKKAPEGQDAKAVRALTRLLRILVMKGILTEAEASSVMHDPVL
ncbi:MAG TPA: PilZ domain-containing protein [Verrucomicrobiae bacterium]|nr:PilZ domain-containing protein [Verrucomicrobiae bacterium]